MQRIKVLFLAANPIELPSLLDLEANKIRNKIQQAKYRDAVEFITRGSVSPEEMQQALLDIEPQVLQFSGHGSEHDGIVLNDERGGTHLMPEKALHHLLSTLKDNLRLVILNSCYSERQAKLITDCVDCTIGMKGLIGNNAAEVFSGALYGGLAAGRSVEVAFELGRNLLMSRGIPEEDTPRLFTREGVDAAQVYLMADSSSGRSSGRQIQLFYAYAQTDDELRAELGIHLSLLKREGVIDEWHGGMLTAGSATAEIKQRIRSADIILLLVSASFLASDSCYELETMALECHSAGKARVIPVILRECDWHSASFSNLQPLPRNSQPITSWPSRDAAYADVARGIRHAAQSCDRK